MAEIRAQIELGADANYIYVHFLKPDRIAEYIIGGVTPKFLAESIRQKLGLV